MWWLWTSLALAGAPWIRPPGGAYSKLSVQRFSARGFVGADGEVHGQQPSVYEAATASTELGLFPGLQLAASLPWVSASNEVAGAHFSNRGMGDLVVELTTGRELGSGWPVALTSRTRWPLYDTGQLRGYGAAGGRFPALGDGQVDADLIAHVGHGLQLGGFQGWWLADAGYRHRTEWWLGDSDPPDREVGDGLTGRVQVGWSPRRGDRQLGWLFVEADTIKAFRPSPTTREQLQLSVGLAGRLSHGLALELGGSELVWTAASVPGWALRGGLSWQREPPPRGSEDMHAG